MKKYIIQFLLAMLPFLWSCADDTGTDKEGKSSVPVRLSGILTRAGETPRNNIYVKAYLNNSNYVYFNETLVTIPAGLSTTDTTSVVFTGTMPYYPFGNREIQIVAYSGKATDGRMNLTAGTDISNDAVLSNYGKRESDPSVNQALYEPTGTIGTSDDPVDILQFRHVMTQLIVKVELDPNSEVDVEPTKVEFTFPDGVVTSGLYPVRAYEKNSDGTIQTAIQPSSNNYTVKLGTNYLVPTGQNLLNQRLRSLTIDNYVALPADLTGYIIQALEGQSEMKLLPGYSYELTLTISRLRVTGMKLTKINWQTHETSANLSFQPYDLALDLGDYDDFAGNDTLNKVALTTTDGKLYVGKSVGGKMQFITLPPSGSVSAVSLYTEKGLLASSSGAGIQYDGTQLTLPLSKGGMLYEVSGVNQEDTVFLVSTPVQFINIANDLRAQYRQVATIDLNTLNLIDADRLFNGFGQFSGVYDGNGQRIDGVDIQASGLFAGNSGTLKNIRLTMGTVDASGSTIVGSICGTNSGTIVACVNEARVVNIAGSTAIQGGIAGQNMATGRIIGCVNTGTILYGDIVGGICGDNLNPDPDTFISCINTGMLNPSAGSLGYIVGQSVPTSNVMVRTSFGLIGSAQHLIGSPELAIGTGNASTDDTSAVEPVILRNGLEAGGDPNQRILIKLNNALTNYASGIADDYYFVYDDPAISGEPVTGITWPAPVMK